MSITASFVILVLIGIRFFMRKAPKVYSYALWGIVLFRLLCPVSFSSEISAFRLLTISESKAETGQEFSWSLALNEYDTSGEIIENSQSIHQNYRSIYQPIVRDTFLTGEKDSAETVDTETVGAKKATVSSEKRNPFFALYVIWASGVATIFFTNMVIMWRLKQKTAASIQLQSRI